MYVLQPLALPANNCISLPLCHRTTRVEAKKGKSASPSSTPSSPSEEQFLEIRAPDSKPGVPLQRSAYRRKASDEDLAAAKQAARRERQVQAAAVQEFAEALKSGKLDAQLAVYKPSVMLVDGYNILYRDQEWRSLFSQDPAFGRAELEKWVEVYAREAQVQCVVVYDAMMYQGKRENHYQRVSNWMTVAFAVDCEADTFIVSRALRYLKRGAYKVIVVTGDQRIQTELKDDELSIIQLDADTFVQHLQECRAGELSGPQFWRSSWALPKLSSVHRSPWPGTATNQHTLHQPSFQGPARGPEAAEKKSLSPEIQDAQALEASLHSIVQEAQKRQRKEFKTLASSAGSAYVDWVADIELETDDDCSWHEASHGTDFEANSSLIKNGTSNAEVYKQGSKADHDDDDDDIDLNALLSKKF